MSQAATKISQTYRIAVDKPQRELVQALLDSSAISGGFKEGKTFERAFIALEGDAPMATLTIENVETILGVIETSMKGTTGPDGRPRSGTLTGAGFRRLSSFVRRLEVAKAGDLGAGCEGVEVVLPAGNGAETAAAEREGYPKDAIPSVPH